MFLLSTTSLLLLVTFTTPLRIILEQNTNDLNHGTEQLLEKRNETLVSHDVMLIDGSICNEYSTGGSLVSSGIRQISPLLAFGKNQSIDVVILSINCIAECLIIQSILEKYVKSTVVLSINSNIFYTYSKFTSFFPPAQKLGNAFIILGKSLNWNRFGIMSTNINLSLKRLASYFEHVAKDYNMTVFPVVNTNNGLKNSSISMESGLQEIEISGVKVMVVMTQEAPRILEEWCGPTMAGLSMAILLYLTLLISLPVQGPSPT